MTLAIARLETECRVAGPGGATAARALANVVDRVAREDLPRALAETLGPSLAHQPEVIRIRRLDIELRLGSQGMDTAGLARAWALAVARALFTALAPPDGHGASEVRRFASRDDYLFAALELALGRSDAAWAFGDIAPGGHWTPADAVSLLVDVAPSRVARVLARLEGDRRLAALLSACDELLLDRAITSWSSPLDRGDFGADSVELVSAALLAHGLEPRWALVDHRQALRLWALAAAHGTGEASPRHVSWALRAIRWVSRHHRVESDACRTREAIEALEALPSPVRRAITGEPAGDVRSQPALDRLRAAVAKLEPVLPHSERPRPGATALASEWMGLLLLSDSVRRLDWWGRLVVTGVLAGPASPQAFRFLLAAVSAVVRNPHDAIPDDVAPIDALFGGTTGDLGVADVRAFFARTDPGVLGAIGVDETSWPSALSRAAGMLLDEFRSRVRGARHATPEFVRRRLLHLRGRAEVEERRLSVVIEASAWSTALHVSGVDDELSLPWLEPRRLVFVLEGL